MIRHASAPPIPPSVPVNKREANSADEERRRGIIGRTKRSSQATMSLLEETAIRNYEDIKGEEGPLLLLPPPQHSIEIMDSNCCGSGDHTCPPMVGLVGEGASSEHLHETA